MRRNRLASLVIAGVAVVAATGATHRPPVWAQAQPGLWEIDGVPDAKGPVRQCVADVAQLAQFEHRGKGCTFKGISTGARSTIVEYSCGGAGFGRSEVAAITPRSLRIETQGVSASLPFSYVLQARRVGDCSPPVAPARH